MRRISVLLAGLAVLGTAGLHYAQTGPAGNPFIHVSEAGREVHVLPPPGLLRAPGDAVPLFASPSNATTVYRPNYGSGNLIDHGGPEIANAGFFAIYWNTTVANSQVSTSTTTVTLQAYLNGFINAFSDGRSWDNSRTDDYTIIQQYGSRWSPTNNAIASPLTNVGAYADPANSTTPPANITDAQIQSYLAALFNSGKITPDANVIYGVYFPAGTTVQLGSAASCSSFCGYHSVFSYSGNMQIKYAVFPYPNCSGCKLSTLRVADMLTIVGSHEIREAVTDPGDNGVNAWYDVLGYEADDKCAWHNLYQITNGGYWVQPEFSNGGTVTASGFTATYPRQSNGKGGCVVSNH